jgi:carbon monoxide dehydrogenase subunit G
MILTNEFVVGASVGRVWGLLDELENVVPCMPGATFIGRVGDENRVSMKVKVGVISSHFQGSVRFVEKNESTHTVVIRGSGKDLGGKASTTATIVARLHALSLNSTRVVLETDLAITGRLAQFGSGVMADISSRMIAQFTANLHEALIAKPSVESGAVIEAPPSGSEGDTNGRTKEHEAFDLGSAITSIALNWMRQYWVVAIIFFVLGWLIREFFG